MSAHKSFFKTLKWRVIKPLLLLAVSFFLVLTSIGIIWVATLKIPDLSAFEARKVAQSTKIYDRTGEILLYDVHSDARRTVIPFEDISDNIKKATIAIEDLEFYEHKGIKPTAIMRAIIENLKPGGITQGGSTITQQVIKNSILTKDKTPTRKLKEWILAMKLEKFLTKDQILNTYLNENPYGGNIYGVEEASKTFFGKSAKDVNLVEAAYIAAIPQAPTFYSPYGKNRDRLEFRKNLVLTQMKNNGYITEEEYKEATAQRLEFLEKNTTGIRAPHFALYVKDYLVKKYGEDVVEEGGLKVITTLDYKMQEKAEKVINNFAPSLEESFGATNEGMVAIDPKTGDILTMVGSRDYFEKGYGNYNIATALRQPGSTFKPFVYATAFMKGYTPETILFDVPTEFSTRCTVDSKPRNPSDDQSVCYTPVNYDGLFEGPETMRQALAHSRNIPAVKTMYLAGVKKSIETAQAMGITSLKDPNRYGLTLVLGGGEVSLLELTSAYGVFANDGIRNPYRSVLKVEDSKGNVLEESKSDPVEAIPSDVARQINDILSDPTVRLDTITSSVQGLNKQIATKTGTTNDFRDVWIVGYTPTVVVGAWAGKNDNTPMEKKTAGLIITPLWGAFMKEINDMTPAESFKQPAPLPGDLKPVLRGIWKGGVSYRKDTVSGKVATEFTPIETQEEVVFPSIHNILHWVNKDTPREPLVGDPRNDSQYENWEYGVRKWADAWMASNPGFRETQEYNIPTETDDVHTGDTSFEVELSIPQQSKAFSRDERIPIFVKIDSRHPLKKTELYINGRYIVTNESDPANLGFVPKDISGIKRNNTIRVIAYDGAANRSEKTIEIEVDR